METGEWIAIAVGFVTILIAIFGMGLVLIQKIDSGDAQNEERSERRSERVESRIDRVDTKVDQVDTKVDEVKAEVNAKSEAQGALIIAELRDFRESVEGRLNGVEREQARQEGILSVLVQRDRSARGGDGDDSDG